MIIPKLRPEAGSQTQNLGTPRQLHELRSLRVAVFHPDDRDGEELMLQLQRIGCKAHACWPPTPVLPEDIDLVFLAVDLKMPMPPWIQNRDVCGPPVIAVVLYENPTIIDAVLKMSVESIVASPVKAFGLLATMVVARQINQQRASLLRQKQRLELKLSGLRQVSQAKAILMGARRISEDEAYRLMREQAMVRRVTVEQIATTIVDAHQLLPLGPGPGCA
jgi:AmiR/NasT family two-component response regulator